MTFTPARQPEGIPTGGQFAATAHAESNIALAGPTTPAAQQERLQAITAKRHVLDQLQNEMDMLNLDAAVASIRRNFPDAAELLVDHARHGWSGAPLDEYEPQSIRDKNGNDITPDDKHWFYRRPAGDDNIDPGAKIHLSRLRRGFFGYEHEGIGYDSATGHRVVDMNHTFSADVFPADAVVLPDSCLGYGAVISNRVDEDGAERIVTAMTSTPDFDDQLRAHLGITDASAPVEVTHEVVYFEEDEGQVYVASCAGKEVTAHSTSKLLEKIASEGAAR